MQEWAAGSEQQMRLRVGISYLLFSVVALWGWPAIVNSAWASSTNDCISESTGVDVHFLTDMNHGGPSIAGLELVGFHRATCDGEPVTVSLSGNEAGDPSQPATKLLSVLDSSLDPCTGKPADRPVVIADGRITLRGCPSVAIPSGAAYADMHDATHLRIEVAGQELPAEGGQDGPDSPGLNESPPDSKPGTESDGPDASTAGDDEEPEVLGIQQFAEAQTGRADVPTAVEAGGLLPDAGGPNASMFWLGVALVAFGTGSLMWDLVGPRRSRGRTRGVH